MLELDKITINILVGKFILDYQEWGINDFGDWLQYYEETIDETIDIVNDYCLKVQGEKYDQIEEWKKVLMINAFALYTMEMKVDEFPLDNEKLTNHVLKVFVEGIRMYKYKKLGLVKLIGKIQISDLSNATKNYAEI